MRISLKPASRVRIERNLLHDFLNDLVRIGGQIGYVRLGRSAGLQRLDLLDVISQVLPLEMMLPAPGQGALAVQCRDEAQSLQMLAPLDHQPTRAETTAERAFLAGLGGGCSVPIAAYAVLETGEIRLQGRVAALDGSRQIDVEGNAPAAEARELGSRLAGEAQAQGAAELLGEGA